MNKLLWPTLDSDGLPPMSGWARARFQEYKERARGVPVPIDDYDQEILASTKRLCEEFRISQMKYNPYRVDWEDEVIVPTGRSTSAPYRVVMADYCTFDTSLIILQKSAKEKLEPKDWEPLIASELAYRYIVQPKARWTLTTHTILPVGIPFLILAGLIVSLAVQFAKGLGMWGEVLIEGLLISTFLAAFIVIGLLSRPRFRRGWFEADRITAQTLGKDALLSALSKADTIIRSGPVPPRAKSFRWSHPSEQERIEALRQQ